MIQHIQDLFTWVIRTLDLNRLSTILEVIVKALAIGASIYGGAIALRKAQSRKSKKLEYTIDVTRLTDQSQGWRPDPYKGENTLCIPGSYYPRTASMKRPLSWLYLASKRLKAAIYQIASRGTPFLQKTDFCFSNYNYAGLDPVFDLLVVNSTPRDIVVIGMGIQICSVAHVMQGMGSPPARMIETLAVYQVAIPNVNALMHKRGAWNDQRLLETQRFNAMVNVEPFADRISLEAGGILRYKLQLNEYAHNVPTLSIIRFFIKSSKNELYWSGFVRLTHIGAEV
jgi:hypothetical protein